jgi:membrane-associated phospholipid phosphatase
MSNHQEPYIEAVIPEARAGLVREDECTSTHGVVFDTTIPKTWDGLLAYVISQVFCPPVLSVVALILIASTLSMPRAWRWAGFYAAMAILTPLLYLVWLLHRGYVSDLDVQLREERARPLIFTLACAGLAWFVLLIGHAPLEMVVVTGGLWLQMAVIYGISLWWKISVHSAAAAGIATLVWSLVGTPLLVIGVPIIAWSRVRLRRHTVAQTIAGSVLGFAIFLGAHSIT